MSRRSLNNYQRKYPLFAWIERHLHKKMDIILGNSKAVVNQLLQDEQVAANKVGLIYNGIHPQIATRAHNRDQIRHALGFGPESVILVIVANLIPYKGHLDLIEALAMIKDQMVESWQLLCVGYDDGYGEKIISAAKTLEIDAYINVMGLRNDIPDILQAADISLLTSHEEGFSNAVLESMSAGLPMIVTDAGGNSEIVENETSGYVVPPHNPKELSKAILKLVHDPHKRQKMGNSGRNIIAEKFTIEKCVDDYEEIYNLLARKEDFTHWKNLKINLDDA